MPSYLRWELLMVWTPDHLSTSAAAFVDLAKALVAENPQWIDV